MPTIDQHPTAAAVAKYTQQVRAFQAHAAVAVGTLTHMIAVNLLTNLSTRTAGDFSAWWSLWALVGWISGLGGINQTGLGGTTQWLRHHELDEVTGRNTCRTARTGSISSMSLAA